MITHGSAYVTDDLDICYARNPRNIEALSAALADLHPTLRGAPADLPFKLDPPTIKAGLNFPLWTPLGSIDILGEVAGVGDYESALRQSESHEIHGFHVCVLTLDALIASKRAAGRRKDSEHLLELEELRKLRSEGRSPP